MLPMISIPLTMSTWEGADKRPRYQAARLREIKELGRLPERWDIDLSQLKEV
jgi:hypothetical protein